MSKAVLVLPEMPDNCFKCKCRRFYVPLSGEIHYTCGAPVGKPGEPVDDFETCRPDWCPLRLIPQRVYYGKDCSEWDNGYQTGVAATLRAIEGNGEDG